MLLFFFLFLFMFEWSSSHIYNANGTIVYAGTDCNSCTCTKRYSVGTSKVPFFDALILCQQFGMELASVMSAEEEYEIERAWNASGQEQGSENGVWLGGTRYGAGTSDFVWITTGRPVIYRKFNPDQPDNYEGKEKCLELELLENSIGWNDLDCEENKLGFICQTRCCCHQNF